MIQSSLFVFFLTLLLFFKSDPAHAYLDPGSVSLVIQAIIATIAGAALTWKHWYWRLLNFFGIKKQNGKSENRNPESLGGE